MNISPSDSEVGDRGFVRDPRVFREPLPVRPFGVLSGAGVSTTWFLALFLLGLPAWWLVITVLVSVLIGVVMCWFLLNQGDRGIAVGVCLVLGSVVSIIVRVGMDIGFGW